MCCIVFHVWLLESNAMFQTLMYHTPSRVYMTQRLRWDRKVLLLVLALNTSIIASSKSAGVKTYIDEACSFAAYFKKTSICVTWKFMCQPRRFMCFKLMWSRVKNKLTKNVLISQRKKCLASGPRRASIQNEPEGIHLEELKILITGVLWSKTDNF